MRSFRETFAVVSALWICLTEIFPSVGWRRGKMRDRHLVVSPGSPDVETVPAMLPNLEAAERDEKCVWCGRTRGMRSRASLGQMFLACRVWV